MIKRLLRIAPALLIGAVVYFLASLNLSAQPTNYCIPSENSWGEPNFWYYCYDELYDAMYCGYYTSRVYEVQLIDSKGNILLDRSSYNQNEGCYVNTQQMAEVVAGSHYTLRVTFQPRYYNYGCTYCAKYPQYCTTGYSVRAFIDWNIDGKFYEDQDPSMDEYVYFEYKTRSAFNNYTIDIPVTVPCGVQVGKARMRVMTACWYPSSSSDPLYANACANGYFYHYEGSYVSQSLYGEIEDYILSFNPSIVASLPDNVTDARSILQSAQVYDGTQREVGGELVNFAKPFVEFAIPQPAGTYLNFKIQGPLPSNNVVYEALDPVTGSPDVQVGGTSSSVYTIQKARGSAAYPVGNSNGSFLSSTGGEYRLTYRVFGVGCPTLVYKIFNVSWDNDLSISSVTSPKTNETPQFFKYLRGDRIKFTPVIQNMGRQNISKFDFTRVIVGPAGDTVKKDTVHYDNSKNPSNTIIIPKQKVVVSFPDFISTTLGVYKLYLHAKLLDGIDMYDYNDWFARSLDPVYTFEIQYEYQLQSTDILLPYQGQQLMAGRSVIPKGKFRNMGVGDASDVPAKLIVYRLSDNSVAYSSNKIVQDVAAGKYNTSTREFDEMRLNETGNYKACLIISHKDDQVRSDDTTCITFSVISGLSGTYTIGNQNNGDPRNFPTIDSAMNTLYYRGLAGPVTYELTDDNYDVVAKNWDEPAWDLSTYIINSGYISANKINSITFKPSDSKALTRGGITINLISGNGRGVAFGQSINPANTSSVFFQNATRVSVARKYADSKGYITFDGGTQKTFKFVIRSNSNVHASAFYLDKGSEHITIKNVLIENGTPSVAQNVWLPKTMFSPLDGFSFKPDTLRTETVSYSYSAGIVMRSLLDKSLQAYPYALDTVTVHDNTIEGNEISGFGYGIMSLGIGDLLMEQAQDFHRFYNHDNVIKGNLIHDVYRTGIYLGYEENSNIINNKIFNVGGGSIAAAGIIAGGDGDAENKGYNNVALNISGNEISLVSSGSYAAGIKVEQQRNSYPHPIKTQAFYPDVPESIKLTNNVIWGLSTTEAAADKIGIHLLTARGSNILNPALADYRTGNNSIINNTIIIDKDAMVNKGIVAGLGIQNAIGTKLYNNAIAVIDVDVDDESSIYADVFYEGLMPKEGALDADRNAYWIPQTSNAAVYRYIETDTNNVILDPSTRDDYKTLFGWQSWTGVDKHSVFGNFCLDLDTTATEEITNLRVKGLPVGSILNNRGDRFDWLTTDIDGHARGTAGQRYDIGAFEFEGGMRVNDLEVAAITAPFAYKATTGKFSDAEYVMTTTPVEVKAQFMNDGSIRASGVRATVSIYKETTTGSYPATPVLQKTITVAAPSNEIVEAGFNLADGLETEFVPQTYADLKGQGYLVPEYFRTMTANVTPLYKIVVEVESDENNNNNIQTKFVRFYLKHSGLGMLVSAENSFKDIKTGTPTKDEIAGRLNFDSVMTGLKKIGWLSNPDSNRFDIDVFDRMGWDAKAVNYSMYRTLVWSDGDDKPLARYQRMDVRNFLSNGSNADKKNLIIGSQEMVRTNESVDLDFVRNVLNAVDVPPSNPLGTNISNNGNTLTGINIGRKLSELILSTGFSNDAEPYAGLMKINPNVTDGIALPSFSYKNHTVSKLDSIAGVASTTLQRNVVLTGVDWRHNSNTEFMLREIVDFIEKNGGSVIPVELTDFNALARDRRVDVSWTTASELNSDRFEVERADRVNGSTGTFETIATEKAAGKSSYPKQYGPVVDRNVEMNHTYVYRLRMFDKDGSSKLSNEAVAVLTSNEVLWMADVTPNPSMGEANISYSVPQSGEIELALYDMAGRKVMTVASGLVETGLYNLKLNVSSLANGSYNLMLTSGKETVSRQINIVK